MPFLRHDFFFKVDSRLFIQNLSVGFTTNKSEICDFINFFLVIAKFWITQKRFWKDVVVMCLHITVLIIRPYLDLHF